MTEDRRQMTEGFECGSGNAERGIKIYKSATASRAWPFPGAFLIPPALLVVADFGNAKCDICSFTRV
jgi:hypothetical protein